MPLTEKGKKVKRAMQKTYGKKKGKQVFYASENKGTIKGVAKKKGKQYMPIYVYECESCHNRFEIKRSLSDDSKVICPDCGSDFVFKVFSPYTFVMKI